MYTHPDYGDCFIEFLPLNYSDHQKFEMIYKIVSRISKNLKHFLLSNPKPKYKKYDDNMIIEYLIQLLDLMKEYDRYNKIQNHMNLYKIDIIDKALGLIGIRADENLDSENDNWYYSDEYTDNEIGKILFLFDNYVEYNNYSDIVRFIREKGINISSEVYEEIMNLRCIHGNLKTAISHIEKGVVTKYTFIVECMRDYIATPSEAMRQTDLYMMLFDSEPRKKTSKKHKSSSIYYPESSVIRDYKKLKGSHKREKEDY